MRASLHRSLSALALTLGFLAGVAANRAVAGEPVRVKGTSVRLAPPDGFVPADRFPGFQHDVLQASIQVSVLPGPVSEIKQSMTKERLATVGMSLMASSAERVNGAEAILLHVLQSAQGAEYEKWIVIAGDERATVQLVGTFPKSSDERLRGAIKVAVLGATWDAAAPADLFEGLPFRLTPAGKLTEVKRMGNSLLLTEPGRPKAASPRDPLYVAAVSHSPSAIPDLAAFSKARAAGTAGMKEIGNFRGSALKIAGLDGYELLADGEDSKSNTPMLLYQVIVPDGTGYWIAAGIVASDRAEECLPVFRRVTESIRKASDVVAPAK